VLLNIKIADLTSSIENKVAFQLSGTVEQLN